MSSGSSYRGTARSVERYERVRSPDAVTRARAYEDHREVVTKARTEIAEGRAKAPPKVQRDEAQVLDRSLASNVITTPEPGGTHAYVVLVDNSGSNRLTAKHLKRSSGHLTAIARVLSPNCRIAMRFCSDHSDCSREQQSVNFITPSERGDQQLFSSIANIQDASGGDYPESIECWLRDAATIPFGDINRDKRTLVLVTDSTPHGMIPAADMRRLGFSDDGCPNQVHWRNSMDRVREHYGNFVLIGSGDNSDLAKWQRKLFEVPDAEQTSGYSTNEAEVASHFIDLSTINEHEHRNAIVGNALLFIMARDGGAQTVEMFLATLYSKWLTNPIFAGDTAVRAEQQIRNFGKYLHHMMSDSEIETMMRRVFVT